MSILLRLQRRCVPFIVVFALLGFSGKNHFALAQSGKLLSAKSKKGYSKSNQSKVFFHDGKWWALAFETNTDQWFVWQFTDSVWTAKSPTGNLSSSARPDVVLNAASNRLYILFPSSKTTDFYRMSYNAGLWSVDAGFPRPLTALGEGDSKTPASLSRAVNGELWIFRINNKILEALRSNDEGFTWSGIITVKAALNYKRGLTDAQAFSAGGKNYIGVAYGETEKAGVKTRFGFLSHRDGDPENSWSDESTVLTMMGKENSTSNFSLAVDTESQLYLFTQNDSGAGLDPRNTLYKRSATTGLWQSFKVNTSALWTSPAIAVQGSSKLFLMGINTGTGKGEYKIVNITKENLAATATANPLFDSGVDFFNDLSAPAQTVDATTQLMVCVENTTAGKIWYNRLEIAGNPGGGGGGTGCTPQAASGPAAIPGTKGGSSEFYKPNQSKVFFHDGTWWVAASSATESEWFLWKKMGAAWIKTISLGTPGSIRPDCLIDSPNNKLYVLTAQTSAKFLRLTYNPEDGTWGLDPGFPVTLTGFSYPGEHPSVIARAKNGDLWALGPRVGSLFARRSSNGGQTWSADIKIKTITTSGALCDVVTFTSNGQNYIGVGYAENTDPSTQFGFLMHKDGDPDNTWTDETNQIVKPVNTQSDDHIAMMISANNEIFMVIKTKPGGAGATGVNLYKRATNGGWSSFPVFKGSAETRPAVAIDETNNELYIFTTLLNAPRYGRYKKCLIGDEASLSTAPVKTFFQNASDDFHNVSVPPHRVTSCTGLMIAAENNTNAKIWYQIFPISGGDAPPPTTVVVGNVTVAPVTANQNAAYTIPLTLGASGSLVAGNVITVIWPAGTTVPATIANTAVSVNGVNATSVTTTPLSRQAVVTVPANIAGGTIATLTFAAAAGIINPAQAANYALMIKTSAQPLDAISPLYAISFGIITPVTIGTVVATPDTVNRPASYTIPLTLGPTSGLSAGVGTITIIWPNDFTLPATMANTAVTVNGVNATAVTTDAGARQITITVPGNLAGGATANLVFLKTAGIKNATIAGDYTLQARTSAQSLNGNSPVFNLKATVIVPPPGLNSGKLLASRTKAPYDKSSQSKIFYLGGKWWTAALDSADAKWYLFSYNGSVWTRGIQIDSRSASRGDFTVDAASNRLYAVISQSTTTYFNRLLYASGSWSLEAQVPLAGFDHGTGANVATITRAKNGFLWVFRINNGMLETQVSMDNGNSWSSTTMLKSGLAGVGGQTDAVTFGTSVGVFYAMNVTTAGARFGFLKHLDSDPVNAWTDESSQFTFFGTENAENWVSANVASDGVVYAMTRNKTSIVGQPSNTLHKRSASGVWSKFKVNTNPTLWTSPTLALDATNKRLYVMGIRTGTPAIGEYKWCTLGNESTLENAPVKEMFKNNTDNFGHVSAPLAAVTNATGLMLVASNATRDDLWFNHVNLALTKNSESENAALIRQQEEEIDSFSMAQVYPNPFNPSTSIRFAVKEPTNVTLQIFNIRGELVRTLVDGEYNRGVHEKRWHGRDNTGNQVASGLYFYRLQIGNRMFSGRMQMLK